MDTHIDWFEKFRQSDNFEQLKRQPIAYFCSEFAISEYLQIYAGGLGILAGDTLREACDQHIPMVAVGMFYRQGYFHHEIDKGEVVSHHRLHISAKEAGLTQVTHLDGSELLVPVPVEDRTIYLRIWRVNLGTVSLYLLDSQVDKNNTEDQNITERLYVSDRRIRILQEMILGVGGARALELMHIKPSVYHMNEGHSAFLSLGLAQSTMKSEGVSFEQALEKARKKLVFTNHTLVAGGNENFALPLTESVFSSLSKEMGVPLEQMVALGRVEGEDMFSMTTLALRVNRRANAVSKIHARKAAEVWPDHPMIAITNGIHLRRWDRQYRSGDCWRRHKHNKRSLLATIEARTGQKWGEDELLIGWGRRVVSYKRPLALFGNLARFKALATRTDKPIRVVMSGKAHEGDIEGAGYLRQLDDLIEGELKGTIVYLSNYSVHVATQMVAGCDIWLNTPYVGFEACGTSGMKAALNGTLPMSTKDGWIDEVDLFGIGWKLSDMYVSESCLDELEYNIAPMYYAQDHAAWERLMSNGRELIQSRYSATRMLRDYIEKLYFPQE